MGSKISNALRTKGYDDLGWWVISLEAENVKLLRDAASWKSRYERLRGACLAYLDGETELAAAKTGIAQVIDELEAEGE